MKQLHKLLLPITIFLLFVGQVTAQELKLPKKRVRCYTDEYLQDLRTKNPSVMSNQDFEAWLQPLIYQFKKNSNGGAQNGTVKNYKVPIVFHIINNGEPEGVRTNISQTLVQQEVLQLNKDYANLSNSPYAVAANTGIQFGLAAVDPTGATLAEPGIDRQDLASHGWTDSSTFDCGNSSGYFWTTIKPATIWDPTKYVNVWVCDMSYASLLGIATFPTASTLQGLTPATETAQNAGIIVDFTSVGSVNVTNPNSLNSSNQCGSNSYSMGKTATHELGHYFGMRHIWGDGTSATTCATDYVADTPPSLVANYGTPTHPKPNVCGTKDEMFEDYMDYSDDHIMNTFTQNQVDRMQTVMLNSPNRKTLNNAVAMVDVVGSNKIKFVECSGSLTTPETGTTGTTTYYHDLSIPLNIENVATDNTSVLTVSTSGTAVAGVDFQIMNPSISFAKGDNLKAIQLRILDNAVIEGDRYVDLSYSLSGTGVTADSNAQKLRVYILDDDNIKIGQNRTFLINQNFGSLTALPSGWYAAASSGYPNSFVVGATASAGMTGSHAFVTNNTSTKPLSYTKTGGVCVLEFGVVNGLSMQTIDTFAFTYKIGGIAASTTTGAPGDDAYSLYYDYRDTLRNWPYYGAVGGTANTGYGPYVTQTTAKRISLIPPYDLNKKKIVQIFYFETGGQTTGKNPGLDIDSVTVRGMPFKVETNLSSSFTSSAPALSTNVFRSLNNKAYCLFKNGPSAIPGLNVSLIDAGTTQATVTTAAGTFNRAKKVFKLAQANVDNSSLDSIIFYYTTSELAVWGANIGTLKVLQAFDGVSITSTLNGSNAVLLTPVVDLTRSVTDSVYTFKVYTKGMGSFMLVDPATTLPLKMLNFKGRLSENTVVLDWTTANEFNTSGFDVQRSTDGENYGTIGWVNSIGTDGLNSYSFNDLNIVKGNKYYYRLKQVDKDGKFTYSSIVIVAYLGGKNWVNVYPNPVKDNLFIQRQNGSYTNTSIVITDASGKVVYQNNSTLSNTLDVETASWSKGIYIIKFNSNEGSTTMKVIKD